MVIYSVNYVGVGPSACGAVVDIVCWTPVASTDPRKSIRRSRALASERIDLNDTILFNEVDSSESTDQTHFSRGGAPIEDEAAEATEVVAGEDV